MTKPDDADQFWGKAASDTAAAPAARVEPGAKPTVSTSVPAADDYWGPVKTPEAPQPGVVSRVMKTLADMEATPKPDARTLAGRRGGVRSEMQPRVAGEGMIEPGNINLHDRPVVRNDDGSISTVRSISANIDGREYLLPTVSDDGRIMSDALAVQQFKETGKHLGAFSSPAEATKFAQQLHKQQEAQYANQPTSSVLDRVDQTDPNWQPTREDLIQQSKSPDTIAREAADIREAARIAKLPTAKPDRGAPLVQRAADTVHDALGGERTIAGQVGGVATQKVGDAYVSAAKIIPETLKLASDIVQLGTGGMNAGFSDWMQRTGDGLSAEQSDKLRNEHAELTQILNNPRADAADVAKFLATHPEYSVNAAVPSVGSMLIGTGGGKAGAELFTRVAARRGAVGAELAAAGSRGAAFGAGTANAAMNAGDTFGQTKGDLADKYQAAAIAAATTAAAGKVFDGGAETTLARGTSGASSRAGSIGTTMLKEAGQEATESVGQQMGQAVGEGRPFDANAIGKQAVLEGGLGGLMGGAAGAGVKVEPKQASAEEMAKAKGFLRPVEARTQASSRFDDLAATHGLSAKAKAAVADLAQKVPLDKLTDFYKRAAASMSARGLFGSKLDEAALSMLDEPVVAPEPAPAPAPAAAPAPAPVAKPVDEAPIAASELLGTPEEENALDASTTPASTMAVEPKLDAPTRTAQPLDEAAHEAAQSQLNDRPEPTAAQTDAGNYKKGHDNKTFPGLDLSIENPVGSVRKDKKNDPPKWQTDMLHHYGYIKGTVAADSTPEQRQGIDFFAKPGTPPGHAGPVFVVDQQNKDGSFDEAKVMLGFDNEAEARKAYLSNYEPGWTGLQAMTPMSFTQFKKWAFDKQATQKPAAQWSGNGGEERNGTSRGEQQPALQAVAQREGQVQQPQESVLPQLRGAGNQDASVARGELPAVQGGSGATAQPAAHAGTQGKQLGISAGEFDLGNKKGTGQQPTKESATDARRANSNPDTVGRGDRRGSIDAAVSTQTGRDVSRGGTDHAAASGKATAGRVIARVGKTPNAAVPIELHENADGTLTARAEGYDLLNYDSGKPIVVPKGTSDADAVAAVKAAGAFSSKERYYPAEKAVKPAVAVDEQPAVYATRKEALAARAQLGNEFRLQKVKGGVKLRRASEAELAAAHQAGQRLKRGTGVNPEGDSLLTAIAKRGGLSIKERADTITEGNKNAGGKMLFTESGRPIDMMAEALAEDGYIPPHAVADDGGVSWLRNAIGEEFGGHTTHYSHSGEDWIRQKAVAAMGDAPDYADKGITDAQLDAVGYFEDTDAERAAFDAIQTALHEAQAERDEQAVEALWQSLAALEQQEERDAIEAENQSAADAGDGARPAAGQQADTGKPKEGDRTGEAARADGDGPEKGLTLSAQTADELKTKTDQEANASALDERAQVDAEAAGFTLQSQSEDKRADTTGDMFGGPSAADAQAAKARAAKPGKKPEGPDLFNDGNQDPDIRLSVADGGASPVFYSELSRQVERVGMNAGPAASWAAWLKGLTQKGVKPDEIEWSGIREWLDMQPGKVSKQQVLDFLAGNGVKVEETTLADSDPEVAALRTRAVSAFKAKGYDLEFDPIDGEATYIDKDEDLVEFDELPRALQKVIEEISTKEEASRGNGAKYSKYQLPGGSNYRELLLTLPAKDVITERKVSVPNGWGDTEGGNVGVERTGDTGADYRSSHWDQPNVLAHVRFNERTDADGKRVLFIEEIQSDWAQEGKKKGFAVPPARVAELQAKIAAIEKMGRDATQEQKAEWVAAMNELQPETNFRKPPTAPFVGKTDAWVALAIKRATKWAIDHGFDRVAFVNGKQSADRYDLSKQISKLELQNTSGGIGLADEKFTSGNLMAYDNSGKRVLDKHVTDAAQIEEHVGKEVARKLLEAKGRHGRSAGGTGAFTRTVEGLDLKVGGEGMQTFYDQIVPKVAKEVVRKLGGDGLVTVEFETKGLPEGSREPISGATIGPGGIPPQDVKQPGFDITPAMRERAQRGVPLFSVAQQGGTLPTASLAGTGRAKHTAYAEDPDPTNRKLTEALERGLRQPAGFLTAVDGSHVPDGLRAARALARGMFGHGVIFTQQHGRRLFNGVAHSRANADFIFIDVDSDKPVMGVLGHELLHRLRANRPDLYDSLRATLGTVLKDQASYGAVINAKRVAKNMEPLSDDVMTEELIADVVGDEFTEPDFWKALGDQQPKGFRKMAQAVLDFLNDVIHSVTKRRPFGTDKYLTDLKAARTAVADAIRQFSADEVGAATSAEDGFKLAVANGELRASSAPLDKVLQLAGGTLLARVTSPGYTKLLTWLDNAGERVVGKPYLYAKAGLQADYGLTPDYKQARSDLQTRIRKGTREAATVVEQLQTLDRAQSRIAYMWMQEKPDTGMEKQLLEELPEESRTALLALKDRLDQLGRQAVDLGMLSSETYERNSMAYLNRSYMKYEQRDAGAKTSRAKSVKILGDQFKGRGLRDDVNMTSIGSPEWFARKMEAGAADVTLKGQKFHRLELRKQADTSTAPMFEGDARARLGKLQKVVYWPASEPIPKHLADWRDDGQWEARFFDKGGKVGMWRDFTLSERTAMGEIQEVRYSAAKTMLQATRDIENARLLDWVARNKSVLDEGHLPAGAELVKASESLGRAFLENEWVQVPTATVPGTAGIKRYGNLAGRYIPGPVWNDLRQIQTLSDQGDLSRLWAKALGAWKISKTALSPATHTNNVLSNFIFADAHDIQARHMARAASAWFNAKDRPTIGRKADPAAKKLIEDYQDNGGDGGKFNEGELREDVMADLLTQLEQDAQNQDGATALVSAAQIFDLMRAREFRQAYAAIGNTKTAGTVKKPFRALIKLYGHEDELFRLAAFIKARDDGLSDYDAGQFARHSFLDYNINAPWIQAARKTAFPFISFTYRAVPMLLRVAADKPHKIAKYLMVAGALNALAYSMLGGAGDDDRERALIPEEKAGKIWGIFPKLMRMPWNDEHGSPVFLDVRRWIPAGDVIDAGANHGAVPVPAPMQPGGPLVILAELLLNKQGFTGKEITSETDTLAEKWSKSAGYLWRSAMPNFPGVPGTYATDSLMDAGKGKTDAFGREKTLAQAALSSVGVKVASYPHDELQRNAALDLRAKIAALRRELGSDQRQLQRKGITQEEFDKRAAIVVGKIQKATAELTEKVNKANEVTH